MAKFGEQSHYQGSPANTSRTSCASEVFLMITRARRLCCFFFVADHVCFDSSKTATTTVTTTAMATGCLEDIMGSTAPIHIMYHVYGVWLKNEQGPFAMQQSHFQHLIFDILNHIFFAAAVGAWHLYKTEHVRTWGLRPLRQRLMSCKYQ